MSTLRGVRLAGALLAACAVSSFAAGPPATGKGVAKASAPDLEFLEYLGTLESDEENWTDIVNVDVQSREAARKNGGKANGKSNTESNDTKVKAKTDDANKSARNEK